MDGEIGDACEPKPATATSRRRWLIPLLIVVIAVCTATVLFVVLSGVTSARYAYERSQPAAG